MIDTSWTWHILFKHTTLCLHAASLSKQPTTGFGYVQMWLQFTRLKTFFHLKLTAVLLIQGLTACVSYQRVSHLFRGRFVYVDIIQNGLQLVMVDRNLKKLSSDKATCDDRNDRF